jgi:hypothetical protein
VGSVAEATHMIVILEMLRWHGVRGVGRIIEILW